VRPMTSGAERVRFRDHPNGLAEVHGFTGE
jgi:hypothetical protein